MIDSAHNNLKFLGELQLAIDEGTKNPITRAVLLIPGKNGNTNVVKLRRDATILGRDKGDILIDDTEISATHCQVQCIHGTFHLFDMNSTNGTFLNGERVVKAKLSHGDIVKVGKTSMVFELQDEAKVRHIATIYKPAKEDGSPSPLGVVAALEQREKNGRNIILCLDTIYGDESHEFIELDQRIVYLGRASSFGKFDADTEISRRHVMIKVNEAGEVFIEDQSSTNGSYINGQRISGLHPLEPTDELRIGACRIRVKCRFR
jgi:pSer/pThr/pTyr-binding forkhead associated (FHA) protein